MNPKSTPKWFKMGSKMTPKWGPRVVSRKRPKNDQKLVSTWTPKRPQDTSKTPQDTRGRPKMPPRRPQDGFFFSWSGPGGALGRLRSVSEALWCAAKKREKPLVLQCFWTPRRRRRRVRAVLKASCGRIGAFGRYEGTARDADKRLDQDPRGLPGQTRPTTRAAGGRGAAPGGEGAGTYCSLI